ncbi:hypothetical protein MTIN_23200 [Moorella thermoacetica]|nr:hypothetical protein MTIN_23200 [Moorella thermoacetica]
MKKRIRGKFWMVLPGFFLCLNLIVILPAVWVVATKEILVRYLNQI